MSERQVDVRPAADPRGHVVNPKLQVLVDRGLERERADDPRSEMFLGRPHVPFGDVEYLAQAGFAEGRAVVSHDDVFRNALGLVERELLVRRQAHMAVQGRLEAPVDAEEPELLPLLLDRGVEEIEVEDRADDVALDAGLREVPRRDDALLEERRRLGLIFLVARGGEESPLQLLHFVMQLHDDEAVDVLRVLDLLRSGKPGFLEDPVVAPFLLSLLRAEEVPTPEERHPERSLDFIQVAVRGERTIRDEDRVRLAKAVLHLLTQHVLKLREHDRLVDHPSDRAAFFVPHRVEVPRVGGLAAFLADDQGGESLLDGTVAHVEGGVRANRRESDGGRIVRLQDFQNRLAADDRPRPLPVRPHGTSEFNPLGARGTSRWRNVFIGRFISSHVGRTTGQMVGGGASETTGLSSFGPCSGSATRAGSGTRGPSRWDRRDGVLGSNARRKPGADAEGIVRRPRGGWRSRRRGCRARRRVSWLRHGSRRSGRLRLRDERQDIAAGPRGPPILAELSIRPRPASRPRAGPLAPERPGPRPPAPVPHPGVRGPRSEPDAPPLRSVRVRSLVEGKDAASPILAFGRGGPGARATDRRARTRGSRTLL